MLTLAQAKKLIDSAHSIATQNGQDIAAAIVDAHGELIAYQRMDNASFQAGVLAQNKAYTAARDRQPSSNLGAWARDTGKDMGYWTDARITGIGGGVPIIVDNKTVGAIGISGMSEEDDEALANKALASISR